MADKSYQIAFEGTPVEDDFYGDVVSLTVEESIAEAGTLRFEMNTALQSDGTWTYLDDTRLTPFTKVSVKIGFSGVGGLSGALSGQPGSNDALQPVFDGYITEIGMEVSSQPGQAHLAVGAMDSSVLMSLEEKIATWPERTDSQIVDEIIKGYPAVSRRHITDTSPLHHAETTTIAQRGTDIQFVRDLARRNGREFFFETDKGSGEIVAYFRVPQLDAEPQPDLAIQFGDGSNLRSFATHLSGQRPLAVSLEQMDVESNQPRRAQADATALTLLGATDMNTLLRDRVTRLAPPKSAAAQMLVLGPPTSDQTELKTIAQTVRDEAGWFIAASGEVNSDAYQAVLRPRRLVRIKGAGKIFSGRYYVTRVVHRMEADGSYTQSFEARRNARDVAMNERFGAPAGGVPSMEG